MPRRVLSGRVVSCKMQKTAVVQVRKSFKHCLYKKVLFRTKRYAVHDPESLCSVGDLVSIIESRPHSKTKAWELSSITEKGG
ncbi:30S ribosomal protein S17 [Candidatus Hydrogenosomobacter endosymbioticus]|uniref:30S ribosomal protein S17 n=1 Tax=Candidatus Hydrogenosomobacter endosymbioticus TaxID=2558174 RepID=UPI001F002950|nr:30S ribosomal protein S17 [Candidatus Hydrogenosomobacter endosymbioticus]